MKTISWRVIAMIISYLVAYYFTNSVLVSFELVLVSNILSMIVYYYHERLWVNY
ncbi:MAG: DUF2061 domain-containing protein [Candidatus Heimdallarchaeota archaeon]|nr:DUF2061 domain-containing protein [Candidatus Heimdallarchaeota archaeon]